MSRSSRRAAGLGAYGRRHLDALDCGLDALRSATGTLAEWGARLAALLDGGGRLLAAGNGGSAAQAQHLTAELVGRYRDLYRRGAYLPPSYRDELRAKAAPLIARHGLAGDRRRLDAGKPQHVAETMQPTLF